MNPQQSPERSRSALTTLSVVGAAVAGAAVGSMLDTELKPIAWWIFTIGITAHLVGMVGVRRLLAQTGYEPPAWQVSAFWLCWAAIAVIVAIGLYKAFQ